LSLNDTKKVALVEPGVLQFSEQNNASKIIALTAHRRENWGGGIAKIAYAVASLLEERSDLAVVWPQHANKALQLEAASPLSKLSKSARSRLLCTQAISYPSMLFLLKKCWLLATDSGGLQEEAVTVGKPSLVLRESTERPEIIACGAGQLVGTESDRIIRAVNHLIEDPVAYNYMCSKRNPFGDGSAATQIANYILLQRSKSDHTTTILQ
jgi:UDP-N-acetylglucosamine 2-epimerase (non-hydrolysing)